MILNILNNIKNFPKLTNENRILDLKSNYSKWVYSNLKCIIDNNYDVSNFKHVGKMKGTNQWDSSWQLHFQNLINFYSKMTYKNKLNALIRLIKVADVDNLKSENSSEQWFFKRKLNNLFSFMITAIKKKIYFYLLLLMKKQQI